MASAHCIFQDLKETYFMQSNEVLFSPKLIIIVVPKILELKNNLCKEKHVNNQNILEILFWCLHDKIMRAINTKIISSLCTMAFDFNLP